MKIRREPRAVLCRTIPHVTLTVAALMVGCGSNVTPSRSARETCRSFGFSDFDVDYFFTLIRLDRDTGATFHEEVEGLHIGCRGDNIAGGCDENPNVGFTLTYQQCVQACSECSTAVANEVFN